MKKDDPAKKGGGSSRGSSQPSRTQQPVHSYKPAAGTTLKDINLRCACGATFGKDTQAFARHAKSCNGGRPRA